MMCWHIIKYRIRMSINELLTPKKFKSLKIILISLLVLIGIGISSWGSMWIFNKISMEVIDELTINKEMIETIIISGVLFLCFMFSWYSAMNVAQSTVFDAKDIELLMSMPISRREIIIAKMVEILLTQVKIFIVLVLPILIVYGYITRAHPTYYPLTLLMGISLLTVSVSLGIIIQIAILGLFPSQRAQKIVNLVIAISVLVSCVMVQASGFNRDLLTQFICRLQLKGAPVTCATFYVIGFTHNQFSIALLQLAILFITAIVMLLIVVGLAETIYYRGWRGVQEVEPMRRKEKAHEKGVYQLSPIRAITMKDFLTLFRDTRQAFQILIPIVMSLNFIFYQGKPTNIELPYCIFLPIFLLYLTMFVLFLTSITKEGKNFWILKAAPITMEKVVLGKLCAVIGLNVSLIVVLSVILTAILKASFLTLIPTVIFAILMGIGMAALQIGIKASSKGFCSEELKVGAIEMIIIGILSGIYILTGILLFKNSLLITPLFKLRDLFGTHMGAIEFTIITVIVILLSIKLGIARLSRMEV